MNYKSSIVITNSSQKTKTVVLEPWAEEFEISSGKSFEFIAKAEIDGRFEIDVSDDLIIVFAWESSIISVFCEGQELGLGAFERQAVPDVPKGISVSTFLKSMFKKESD